MSETRSFGSSTREGHDSSAFYNLKLYQGVAGDVNKKEQARLLSPKNRNSIPAEYLDSVINGDACNMKELPDNSIHMMITSPPYAVGKDYDENLTLGEYLSFLRKALTETFRVLVPGGRAAINVAGLGRKPYIPIQAHVALLMSDLGFLQRGEIIWQKGETGGGTAWGTFAEAMNPVLRDAHEYVLVFSKPPFSREPGPSTILHEEFVEFTSSVWRINPASAKRVGHPAPFPPELVERLVKLYTYLGDVVLDPFMGSGTTGMVAFGLGRHFVGYEINKEYIDLANERIFGWQNTQHEKKEGS